MMKNSVLGRLWLALVSWYDQSTVHRALAALGRGWSGWFRGSRLMHWVTRDGTLPRAWEHSVVGRGLEALVNRPAAWIRGICRHTHGLFQGSLIARLLARLAHETPYLIGWFMLLVVATPYNYSNNMVSLAGFLAIAALYVVGGAWRGRRLETRRVGPYLTLFVAAVALSWVFSYRPEESFRFLFFHLTCILCVVVTVSAVERPEELKRLAAMGTAALALVGGYGVVQGIQGVPVNYSYTDVVANAGMPGRVYSTYENPNTFAQLLVLLIPLAAALVVCSRSKWGKLAALASAALGVVSLFMTYSRSSYVGLAVAVVVFLFLWKRKLLPALVVVAVAAIPFLPQSILNRILSMFNSKDSSTSSRLPLYQAATELISLRPVEGAGLGTDVVRSAIRELNTYHGNAAFVHAHNLFLQLWLETGILGLVSFTAGVLGGVKSAAKAVHVPGCPRTAKLMAVGGAAAICGVVVNSLADYIWNYPRVMLVFWFVFAVMLAAVKVARKSAEQ